MTDKPEIEHKKITDFSPDNANANRGTERGLRMLDNSIAESGLGRSIVVDKHGYIIAGNKTTERAVDRGFEDAIVVHTSGDKLVVVQRDDLDLYANDPENKARLLAYYDNRSSQLSLDWNAEQLLADNQLGVPLDKFFSGDELLDMGVTTADDPPQDAGAQVDKADELQAIWQVERGQLWVIPSLTGSGEHRLLCGDSTNADDVATVMSGQKVNMMFTDPPYGVDVVGGTRDPRDEKNFRSGNNIENDDLNDSELETIVAESFKNARQNMIAGAAFYVWHPSSRVELFAKTVRSYLAPHRQILIWVKDNFVFGRQDYHWQHEPCFYGWIDGAAHHEVEDRTQGTVWQVEAVGTDLEKKIHPTVKPLGLATKAINNSTPHDAIVYDPFLGSGTTMAACETLGRVCFGIEIEPKYCAVILQRMTDLGCTPVKAN